MIALTVWMTRGAVGEAVAGAIPALARLLSFAKIYTSNLRAQPQQVQPPQDQVRPYVRKL